jgi:hypothetical protein
MGILGQKNYGLDDLPIQIIKSQPGPSTTEQIRTLILAHPNGITLRQICQTLNRPVSMVQRCLKPLMRSRQIYSQTSQDGMSLVYFSLKGSGEQAAGSREQAAGSREQGLGTRD